MPDLGERMRMAVDATGRTQEAIAIEAGVPPETLSRIITGDSENPKLGTLKKLARPLGVSVGWLLGEPTANFSADEAKGLLEAIEVMRARLRVTCDSREHPNAQPFGKLRGLRLKRELADLMELPDVDIYEPFRRDGADLVFYATDESMRHAGIVKNERMYIRGDRSLRSLKGHVIVFKLNGSYYVKRLVLAGADIVLTSAHEDYMPIAITRADDFVPVGIVVGRMCTAADLVPIPDKRH